MKRNLLETTPSPRIIIIGGSNVAFGIDSQLMEARLGLPVINDGLHAGLGVAPIRELRKFLRAGDIVIISLEYSNFSSKELMDGDPAVLSDWIEFFPERILYLESPWIEAPSLYGIMLQRKVNRAINLEVAGSGMEEIRGIFTGNHFNSSGDFIGHLDEKPAKREDIPSNRYAVSPVYDEIFPFLEDFNRFAQSKGVKVYFEAQSSRQMNCENTGIDEILAFFQIFRERTSIPVITPENQLCMPDKYFFDTPFHLNAKGREIRTERLIENLLNTIELP